jgi:outer membrane protein
MKSSLTVCERVLMTALIALVLSLDAGTLFSGEVPKRISLREAISIAMQNNHDYQIALKKLRAADERVNSVWGQLMPVLETEGSLMRQSAENGFMSLSDGQYDIKIVQMKFGINPGMFYNSLQLSKKSYQMAKEEVRRMRSVLSSDVIKAYFAVLIADEMITLRKDALRLLKENLKDVQNQYRTGSVPRFELLQAQVRLKSQEPHLIEAENAYRVALDLLNYHLGCGGVEYTADSSILDAKNYRLPEGAQEEVIQRLSEIALKNRPELIQLQMKREMARHASNINSSYYLWPTFSIGGYYGKTKLLANPPEVVIDTPLGPVEPDLSAITGTRDWQTTWQIRVAATYRWGALLPTDSVRATEREELVKVQQAEEELLKLKRVIQISIKSNYSDLVTSCHTIISREEGIEAATEGLRIARESYRAGVIKNSELLSAQFSLTEARTGYINAVNRYYLSLAELKREIGVDDEEIIFGSAAKQQKSKK